eukprot:945357-Pleurochrysis_carterae.AAC.1
MHRLVPGIVFNKQGSRCAPFLIYADDGIILTDSVHTLQLAMEVMFNMRLGAISGCRGWRP